MAEKVFVKLTETELAARSRELAEKVCMLESLRLQKKEDAAEIGRQIRELDAEIQELATAIRSGHEERDAQVELVGIRKIEAAIKK